MKPVTTFIRHNGIKALISLEKGVRKISKGRYCRKRLFNCRCEYVGTDVRIIKETDTATFIAKCDENGNIVDKPFKILVATDIHLGGKMRFMMKSLNLLARHIADEKPDLVIFTGDVVQTDYQQIDSVQFAQYMEEMGVYWAYVFGNHEAREEKEYHKYFVMENMRRFPHCLSKHGDPSLFGYGNFMINIMNSEKSVQQSLVFFDSGRNITSKWRKEYNLPDNLKGYDFLKQNQIDWYKREITALRKEYGEVKSMMFMHIPLPEYAEVMDGIDDFKYVPSGKAEILYGKQFESVGSSPYNSGMFDAILELGSTQAVFAGHDHINDFCAIYKGVHLVYVQCSGYEEYNLGSKLGVPEDDWPQGVTMVDIDRNGEASYRQRFNITYLKENL